MQAFEYRAIPAPDRGTKAKGLKTTAERFALSMTETINEMAALGWDYVRAETLPCVERKGLGGTQTNFQNVLIFRRRLHAAAGVTAAPLSLDTPAQPAPPEVDPATQPVAARQEPRLTSASAPAPDAPQS